MARRTTRFGVRHRPFRNVQRIRERAGIRLVEIQVRNVNFGVGVAGLVGNDSEDIGLAVPTAQRRKTPIDGDGANGAIVVVEGVVGGAVQAGVDDVGTTDQNAEDVVVLGVGFILVKSQEQQGTIHEVGVIEQWCQPVAHPGGGKGDVGVVTIISHIGSNESPLRQGLARDITVEAGEVLDKRKAGCIGSNAIEENERIVLADVVVGKGDLLFLS